MAFAVDEEAGGRGYSTRVRAGDVLRHAFGVSARTNLSLEAVHVEAQFVGVVTEVHRGELILVREEQLVHRPESTLSARRLGCLGCDLSVRMHVGKRKVAPHVTQILAEGEQQFAHDALGLAAVRTFVVAVLDERDRRVGPASDATMPPPAITGVLTPRRPILARSASVPAVVIPTGRPSALRCGK
jgi:hypothetical protein